MTLEQLVPSLDFCQQLHDAGFPQDTALVWVGEHEYDFEAQQFDGCHVALIERSTIGYEHEAICAAPTAGELEEWLMTHGFFSKRAATIQIAYRAVKVGEALDPNSSTSVSQDVKWVGHYFVTAFNGGGESLGQCEKETSLAALTVLVLEVAG